MKNIQVIEGAELPSLVAVWMRQVLGRLHWQAAPEAPRCLKS